MFLSILSTILSTIIIASIISLILYLISLFNNNNEIQGNQEFLTDIQEISQIEDELLGLKRGEDDINSEEENSSNGEFLKQTNNNSELHVLEVEPALNEQIIKLSENENIRNERYEKLIDENNEAISEANNEKVSKDHIYLETTGKIIDLNENTSETIIEDTNNTFNDLIQIDDSQNLTHFNKSRPKKAKSRPSVKIIFNKDSEDIHESEDSVSRKAKETVDDLFEALDYDQYNETVYEEKVVKNTLKFDQHFNDESFEEISTGDYKKFDEFSDYFSIETKRQEFIRKCEASNKLESDKECGDEIEAEDNKQTLQTNDEIVDELFSSFIEESNEEMEVIESSSSVTQFSSLEIINKKSVSVNDYEKSVHTEKANFKLSLSKVFSNSEINLSPSKSPLSATIESATKPLLSSPTLNRKSISSLQSGEIDEHQNLEDVSKRIKRISLPMFGSNHSSLIDEMKEKQFQKSLKIQNSNSDSSQDTCDKSKEKQIIVSDL